MQFATDEITKIVTEVIIILLGYFGSILLAKAKHYLDGLKKKDELGIIDKVTTAVVHYAEAELTGAKGAEKRSFAARKISEILASKGIKANEDEILAGIEEGVSRLKMTQNIISPVTPVADPVQPVQTDAKAPESPATSQPEQPAPASNPQ